MELLFALYKPKEFDYTLHRHFHVMETLLVYDIKCYSTALYFVGAGREVHRACTQKKEVSMSSPTKGLILLS
jgi:hypothetical protein